MSPTILTGEEIQVRRLCLHNLLAANGHLDVETDDEDDLTHNERDSDVRVDRAQLPPTLPAESPLAAVPGTTNQQAPPHVDSSEIEPCTLKSRMETALRCPVHVDQYPTNTGAGQPVLPSSPPSEAPNDEHSNARPPRSDNSSNSASSHGYSQYASSIANATGNPYAPFQTKMEWEIARWAALRGPGSTANSELLGIEGVSEFLL